MTNSTILTPDLEQAQRHLNALSPDGGVFTFQTFDDNHDRKSKALAKVLHGNLDQHASQLTKLGEQGAGVYVTVNQTDGKGRKDGNITAIRGLFLDFDNERPQRLDDLKALDLFHTEALTPSLIVESSTGKHHAYWLCDGIAIEDFSQWQERLISHYRQLLPMDNIDSLKDLPRVLRLAGFYHRKIDSKKGLTGEPVLSKIVYEGKLYTLEEVRAFIDSLPAPDGQTSQSKDTNTRPAIVADFEDFTKDEPIGLSMAEIRHYLQYVADNSDYDTWLKIGMILHHEFKSGHGGLDLWNDWSETAPNYAGYDELADKWQTFDSVPKDKPTTAKTLIHMAKQNAEFESYTPDFVEMIEIFQQLATLDESHYQAQRKDKAKALGLTPASLDKAVYAERKKLDSGNAPEIVSDTTPYGEVVNGDELAGEIYQIINRHIACDDSIAVAVTLWIFFTWCIDVAYIAPIAWINAPEKRCGKTQLATLIGRMSKRPLLASNMAVATFFRTVDKYNPTLIIDEADTFINKDEDLRGAINAGFSRDNCYFWRCTGDNFEPTAFNVFGAKVISGIGKLPTTIMDRSISLTLRRAMPTENKERLRDLPQDITDTIKAKLARWADDNMANVRTQKPIIPESIYNRDFDNWEILFQIADILGGNWLERVTLACLNITGNEPVEPSLNEQLLMDIKTLFERHSLERISSKELLQGLTGGLGDEFGEHEPMIWETYNHGKPMSDRQLAKRLKEFGITSRKINIPNEKQKRGYYLEDFKDAFMRYLP